MATGAFDVDERCYHAAGAAHGTVYFKMLAGLPALDILAFRIVWSVPVVFVILYFRQGILDGVQWATGQQIWDPSIRFLTELPSQPDPVEIATICIMALVFSFLATLYPAWRAAQYDPVEALRYE